MSSEQARRENVVKEREVKVEKDKVSGQEGPGRVGVELTGEGREELDSGAHGFHGEKARHAQLLAAGGEEMRERKGQESVGGGGGGGRIQGGGGAPAVLGQEGPGRVGVELTGEGREELDSGAHGFHGEKARHAQLLAAGGEEMRERKGQESGGGGGRSATDTVTEKGRQGAQKAVEAKDIAAEKSQRASEYLMEKGKETGNLTAQKGQEAKEQTISITGKAKDYTVQKAGEAMEMSKEAAEYAKETIVEGGKETAHYAGVAAEKAAAVGWTAAHFTTEKVVQGTKVVAGTVEGGVGYAGHKAADVGSKAVDLTKEKAAAAADTVVGYTARKKEEAQHKDQETHQGGEDEKRSEFVTEPRRGFGEEYGEDRESNEDVFGYGAKGMAGEARRDAGEKQIYGGRESNERYLQEEGVGEIAKNKTNVVIGDAPGRTHEHGATDYMGHEHGHR